MDVGNAATGILSLEATSRISSLRSGNIFAQASNHLARTYIYAPVVARHLALATRAFQEYEGSYRRATFIIPQCPYNFVTQTTDRLAHCLLGNE